MRVDGARLGVAAAVATCLAGALTVTLWRIDCPGLYYDEVFFVDGWKSRGVFAWRPFGIPLMQLPYLGALKTWAYWPFADHLTPASIRVPAVLCACISILIAGAAAARLAGAAAALLAVALLASDPAFLFLHRLDWGPIAIGTLLRAASFLLIVQWRDDRRPWRLVTASALVGVGLYDKIVFAWYVIALVVALVTWPGGFPRPSAREVRLSVAAALLGAAPLVAYNLAQHGATFAHLAYGGQSFPTLLRERWALIADTLAGRRLHDVVNGVPLDFPLPCPHGHAAWTSWACAPFPLRGSWLAVAVSVALASVLLMSALRNHPACRPLAVVVALTAGMFLPLSLGTAHGQAVPMGPHHVATIFPFPQMLVATACAVAIERWRRWRAAVLVAIALVVATSAAVSVRTATSFGGVCGRGLWSSAIYDAARFVERHVDARIVLGDWGFSCPLRVLAPQVPVEDLSWALVDGTAVPEMLRPRNDGRTFLLVHRHGTSMFPRARRRALTLARATGCRTKIVDVLHDLDGRANGDVVELLCS